MAKRTSRTKTEREAVLADKRAKRAKLGGNRDVLTVTDKEPGYVYRTFTVNDHGGRYTPERLEYYKSMGWEHVSHDTDIGDDGVDVASNIGSVKGKRVGGGDTLYVMRIEEELYNEAQAAKQREITEKERSMQQQLNSGNDGQYGKVEIQ